MVLLIKGLAYTPKQNGAADRQNRTIVEAVRTILQESGFNKSFCTEAANTIVNMLNISGKSTMIIKLLMSCGMVINQAWIIFEFLEKKHIFIFLINKEEN